MDLINLLTVIHLLLSNNVGCEHLQYQVIVPKYICGSSNTSPLGPRTIRLQGIDAQNLSYDWKVSFLPSGEKPACHQRCTLLTWRSARHLERHLKHWQKIVNQSRTITLTNAELIPGVQYILHLSVTKNAVEVDTKEFSLAYASNPTIRNSKVPFVSVQLFGSAFTYAYTSYIINAEMGFCKEGIEHYYKWRVNDIKHEHGIGHELEIPPNTFIGNRRYVINCTVYHKRHNTAIATDSLTIDTGRKGLSINLSAKTLSAGVQQPLKLHSYFKDLDNTYGIVEILWECVTQERTKCSNFTSINQTVLQLPTGFSIPGRFIIKVTARKNGINATDTCNVLVVEAGLAQIEIYAFEQPTSISEDLIIRALVTKLTNTCLLQWSSVFTDDYSYLDLEKLPRNIILAINITAADELDKHTNKPVLVKQWNFMIPNAKGSWKGLQGNEKYMFRLNVTCPEFVEDDENSTEITIANLVTLFADVPVRTNAAPILNKLEIFPLQGASLKTLFYFETLEAIDDREDYPILYKFGYILNGTVVHVARLNDITFTKALLPYVDGGVTTVLEGCDNRMACSQIYGPKVITFLRNNYCNTADLSKLQKELGQRIFREEYYYAFTFAVAILKTYENCSSIGDINDFLVNVTNFKIRQYLESEQVIEKWIIPAKNLLQHFRVLSVDLIVPESVLNNAISLRNKVSNSLEVNLIKEN